MTFAASVIEVEIKPVPGGVFSIVCKTEGCDFMSSAASQGAATRKKNKHLESHRAATHGGAEMTIYDAIEEVADVLATEPIERGEFRVREDTTVTNITVTAEVDGMRGQEIQGVWIDEAQAFANPESLPPLLRGDTEIPDGTPVALRADGVVVAPGHKAIMAARIERLEALAGAPDTDRPAWLAMRRNGVTATEIAKIARSAYPAFVIEELVREKIQGSNFNGNAYTEWGREREPHLEKRGRDLHNLTPEKRVFSHQDNPRYLASPDAWAALPHGGLVLGEYKTSGKALTWDQVQDKGYYDQIQWQMFVLDAERAVLMWEWRHQDADGSFYAEYGGEHQIARDTQRIQHLVALADRFLAALDDAVENGLPNADPWLERLVNNHIQAKIAATTAEEALRDYLDEVGVEKMRTQYATVSYGMGSARRRFDQAAFKDQYPDLYDAFMRDGSAPERPTLRVTPRKIEETP